MILLLPVLLLPALLLSRRGRRFLAGARRFLAGHPTDGIYRTNATFTRGATRVMHPSGRAHPWHWRPGWQRGAVRLGAVLLPAMLAWGLLAHRSGTIWVLAIPAAACVRYGAWRLYRRPGARHQAGLVRRWLYPAWDWHDLRRNRRKFAEDTWAAIKRPWVHYWYFRRPARHALTEEIGAPPSRLEIEPDRSRVVVGVPVEFTGSDGARQAIERAVTTKLAISDAEPSWRLHGRKPCLTLVRAFPPPRFVTLPDILADIRAAKPDQIVHGIGKRDERVITSVKTEAPWSALSMGTGKGKSETSGSGLAQLLFHGALGVVLDVKMFSHQWAKGLPNVAYARTPEQITAMLMWLDVEVKRRNEVADAEGGVDKYGNLIADVGPPIYVLAEELNATQGRLAKYYRQHIKQKGDPSTAPAVDALGDLLFTGRQVLVSGVAVAQRISAKSLSGSGGNADARENIGAYFMCDPSLSAWKMHGWDHPLPPACGHKGRIQVVTPSEVRETQAVLMTPEEKRELATAGKVAEPRWDMPLILGRGLDVPSVPSSDRPAIEPGQGQDCPISPALPALPGITLAEAADAGMFGHRKAGAVKKQLQRDPEAPSPIVAGYKGGPAHRYDEEALREYAAK